VTSVSAGGGLTTNVGQNSAITGSGTISHTDTSTQANVNNSGRTYIQDINLDTYGHVTSIGSTTVPPFLASRYINWTSSNYINVPYGSWAFCDSNLKVSFIPSTTGYYIVKCGYGSVWHWNPNWIICGLSNAAGTSPPNILPYQTNQVQYPGGGYYHREQLHATFICQFTVNNTYTLNLAVKKIWNYTMRIYRGSSSSSNGYPDAYITVQGPLNA